MHKAGLGLPPLLRMLKQDAVPDKSNLLDCEPMVIPCGSDKKHQSRSFTDDAYVFFAAEAQGFSLDPVRINSRNAGAEEWFLLN